MSATRKSSFDCHHMAFGISPAAAKDVVREVKKFLEKYR